MAQEQEKETVKPSSFIVTRKAESKREIIHFSKKSTEEKDKVHNNVTQSFNKRKMKAALFSDQ